MTSETVKLSLMTHSVLSSTVQCAQDFGVKVDYAPYAGHVHTWVQNALADRSVTDLEIASGLYAALRTGRENIINYDPASRRTTSLCAAILDIVVKFRYQEDIERIRKEYLRSISDQTRIIRTMMKGCTPDW